MVETPVKPHVVFFGSGPVAARSLDLLLKHQKVEAVITKPTTFKEMTDVAGGIPVYTVASRSELDKLISDEVFTSKLGILIDFGIIVSKKIIEAFDLGIINSHFSLLPQWRGADPISFAILSGQLTTGVSLMLLDEGMDTGKILVTRSTAIVSDETTPTLTTKLIALSDDLLSEYVPRYLKGEVQPRAQSHPDRATYSRKLTKENGVIDWNKEAKVIEREIRAFIDWPKSRTKLANKDVIVTKSHLGHGDGTPGTVKIRNQEIMVFCGKDALVIDELKPAGKNKMPAKAFLAGYGHLFQ